MTAGKKNYVSEKLTNDYSRWFLKRWVSRQDLKVSSTEAVRRESGRKLQMAGAWGGEVSGEFLYVAQTEGKHLEETEEKLVYFLILLDTWMEGMNTMTDRMKEAKKEFLFLACEDGVKGVHVQFFQ